MLVMLVLSGLHDFVIGPAAARLEAGSEAAAAFRVRASRLARVNAMVGLVLVVAAVRLAHHEVGVPVRDLGRDRWAGGA